MAHYQPTISDTMRDHVSVILNSGETTCLGTGIKIAEYPKYINYHIDCIFKGIDANGEPFEIRPLEINKFFIEQDFDNSYMDHYEINVTLRPVEYLTLYEGYQNLACDVILRQADPKTGDVKGLDVEGDPVVQYLNYRVIFKNKQDILKKFPKQSIVPEEEGDVNIQTHDFLLGGVAFQLIDDASYKLRVKSFSFQLTDSTVKDAILFIAHSCDISTVAFVEPENEEEIENIVMPPIHTFNTALNRIQEVYGVYSAGLGYYYTGGVLYIYPKYDMHPSMPTCPKEDVPAFYYIGGSKFPNMEVNHAVDVDNNTHIVINAANMSKDQVDAGLENDGTGILIAHADRIIDEWRSVQEAHSVPESRIGLGAMTVHKTPNTELFSLTECERKRMGIDPTISIIKYKFDECNVFKCRLPINRYKRTTIQTAWENAIPQTFRPGYRVTWNYDGEDPEGRDSEDAVGGTTKFMTKTGVMEQVSYVFSPVSRLKNRYLHKCVAPIFISVEMDFGPPGEESDIFSNIDEASANRNMGGGSSHKVSMGRGRTGCPKQDMYNRLKAKDPSELTQAEASTLGALEAQLEAKRQRLIKSGSIY